MKKYLGIVKKEVRHMGGISVELLSKSYDEEDLIKSWFELYPDCEHVLLLNTKELDSMFSTFEDLTPISDEEKEIAKKAKKILEKIMNKR